MSKYAVIFILVVNSCFHHETVSLEFLVMAKSDKRPTMKHMSCIFFFGYVTQLCCIVQTNDIYESQMY